jgi:Rieske Fe-S protein
MSRPRNSTPAGDPASAATPSHSPDPPRRNVVAAMLAVIIGGIVGIVPFAAGVVSFLDPLFKRKKATAGEGQEAKGLLLRVATVDSIPSDGTPIQVPVISDLADAWNREPNQPIGAVFLRKAGDQIKCFSAICPHAGCRVGYIGDRNIFQCPCHTSAFSLDGERHMPSPSPRDMDTLDLDAEKLKQGEVWVHYQNFYPGREEKEEK